MCMTTNDALAYVREFNSALADVHEFNYVLAGVYEFRYPAHHAFLGFPIAWNFIRWLRDSWPAFCAITKFLHDGPPRLSCPRDALLKLFHVICLITFDCVY